MYAIKTRTVSEKRALDSEGEFKSLTDVVRKLFEICQYSWDEMADAVVLENGKPAYSVKFHGFNQLTITELL